MESPVLDPFGDYETAGYLRNFGQEKSRDAVTRLEALAFADQIFGVVRYLRRHRGSVTYEVILDTHRRLFSAVYPWAGTDRLATAPHLSISKGGYQHMFALPASIRFAADYALGLAADTAHLRAHPGEVSALLAHAHPFLEGNGRTILTVFAELTQRAGFHIAWEDIDKVTFLRTLTDELLHPGAGMDGLVLPYLREGRLTRRLAAERLHANFQRAGHLAN